MPALIHPVREFNRDHKKEYNLATHILTYSFAPAGLVGYAGATSVALTAGMKANVRAAFRMWEQYCDALAVEVPHDGTAWAAGGASIQSPIWASDAIGLAALSSGGR